MLKSKYLIFTLVVANFILGCASKNDDSEESTLFCTGSERRFNDVSNDSSQEFVDLTKLKLIIGEDCIGTSISVSNLPATLTFNHSSLPDNYQNYVWSVAFDMDGDGSFSTGDLKMSVQKFKRSGSVQDNSDILSATQEDLSERTSSNSSSLVTLITASISGNTFNLSVPKSAHSSLSAITTSTKVQFEAKFNDGVTIVSDYYPSNSQFENELISLKKVSTDGVTIETIIP